jgi:hypothetical protein
MRYLIVLALALTSCAPLYLPATRNAPLFDEQGEAQFSGYLSSAGIEAQAAYSLTDNIAITGSYAFASQKKTSNSVEYTRKNNYAEFGLGLYNTTRSLRWEILGGYGFGEGTSSDVYYFFAPVFSQGTETVATGKMTRIFLQPSVGTNNRGTNLSFTPKISWVDYSEFTSGAVTLQPVEDPIIFFEPAGTLKFHLAGNLFVIGQIGLTLPISGEPYFKYQQLSATVGIQIDTGGLGTRVYK